MKLPLYILIVLSLSLTGCFHHKSKKERLHKSRPVVIQSDSKTKPPAIIRLPKEINKEEVPPLVAPKEEPAPQILPGERIEEKKSEGWWFW